MFSAMGIFVSAGLSVIRKLVFVTAVKLARAPTLSGMSVPCQKASIVVKL